MLQLIYKADQQPLTKFWGGLQSPITSQKYTQGHLCLSLAAMFLYWFWLHFGSF